MSQGPGSTRHARSRGFTLIEIVVVLLIFSVVVAMAATLTRGVTAAQRRSLTATRIATVEAALVQYVLQQKRLPMPADGTLSSTANCAGLEAGVAPCAALVNQQNGVVPWRTLALTEAEATDAWDRRLTYRVFPALTAAGGMDMSWCDPAGTEGGGTPRACSTTCVATNMATCTPPGAFLATKGLRVQAVRPDGLGNPIVLMDPAANPPTGAAYVVVSPGESGGGGYLASGTLGASSVGDGTEEMKNYASLPYTAGVTYYVDDAVNTTAGATHFDDIVLRPSVLSVISKAGLGPRSH